MPAPLESFPILRHDVYPGIAPERFAGIYKGKVVFITGASKLTGLGFASAKAYAQSGANIFITGRNLQALEVAAAELGLSYPGKIGYSSIDITVETSVKAAVQGAIDLFGHIDIVIANAGQAPRTFDKLFTVTADEWLEVFDANFRGAYLTASATIMELARTKGYIVLLSSGFAQTRYTGMSQYNLSKHAINRLAEWIDLEYADQGVKSFSVSPGAVKTDFVLGLMDHDPVLGQSRFIDTPGLSAWTQVRLTSGTEDWLSGRFVESGWDLDEIQIYKQSILETNSLKNRLAMPSF